MPLQAASRNMMSSGRLRPDGAAEPALSELERVQYRFHSTTWVFYLFAAMIAGSYFASDLLEDWICLLIVAAAAFVPVFLWARKVVLGMPIMPVYAIVCLVYYGFPFVSDHPLIQQYSFAEKSFAAFTVAVVLVVMTVIWAFIAKTAKRGVRVVRTLSTTRGAIRLLMGGLVLAIIFQSNLMNAVISPGSELYGVARAILLTLGLLSVFCLSYLLGAGTLVRVPRYLFVFLAIVFIGYHAVSLYLITAMQYSIAVAFGYFLGSGRVPWKLLVAFLAIVTVLQAGKVDTRIKYWEADATAPGSPVDLIVDWFRIGLENLADPGHSGAQGPIPVFQRTSLTHILLKTQTEAPNPVPYLYGSSYARIPLLAIPRVIWPERPNVSASLVELNMQYGLLTEESAQTTSIGWGMIAEANANFGFAGSVGLAMVLGLLIGLVQKFGGDFTVLSARGMTGLLVMSALLGVESSAAQFLTILAQSFVPLLLLTWIVMDSHEVMA